MSKKKQPLSTFNPAKMLLTKKSPFSVQEAYKTLRTNLAFSLPGNGCKCIGIVSSNRSDGKSSVAVNLAISFAQINKRVVLIDCDMRLPTIASKLNIKAHPGLSNFLVGTTESVPIQHLDDFNLDVIPSGNIPPDSATLLASAQMRELVARLRLSYDYVILDFPPIAVVSDAAILSQAVDGYLIVVRHEVSEFQKIEETLRQMHFADAKILGFVYNAKNTEKSYYKKYNKNYYKDYYYKKD